MIPSATWHPQSTQPRGTWGYCPPWPRGDHWNDLSLRDLVSHDPQSTTSPSVDPHSVLLVRFYSFDFGLLRQATRLFLVLMVSGLLLMSLATGAFAPLMAGFGVAALWTGCLVVVAAFYAYGLQSGDFLLSPRLSITAIIAFFGLAVTAIVAAVEFTVK